PGKALGFDRATKGGLGTSSVKIADGRVVGALVIVNAFGDVVDPRSGRILAGARKRDGAGFLNTAEYLKTQKKVIPSPFLSTTIGVVATNARLGKEGATKVAQMAHDGLARTIVPVHTELDGDVLFALAAGDGESSGDVDVSIIGLAAAEAVSAAVIRAVQEAETLHGIPAARDLRSSM
ncbi:MAG: P1 family peptidase, partial [Chloroflexi bacterium]|nr:P1 family peptidase [Chloroflexota bacterium]